VKFARNIRDGGLYLPFQARVFALELLLCLVGRFGNQLLGNYASECQSGYRDLPQE
jgi:hypothetical protein